MKVQGNYFYVKKADLKSGYTQVPNALFHLKLTAIERLVLAYLFSNAESFRITNYRIEKVLRSDFRTIKKALTKLHKLNLIEYKSPKVIIINIKEIERLGTEDVNTNEFEDSLTEEKPIEERDNKHIENTDSLQNPDLGKDNCNLTSSCITANSTSTGSKTPGSITVGLQSTIGRTTGNLTVENNNNKNRQQERKEEKQKEVSPTSSISEIQDEIEEYLKSSSKFFMGDNQLFCTRLYEQFRIEYSETRLTSILAFQNALYYHMLNSLNANDTNHMNEIISQGGISITLADLLNTVHLIISKKDVYQDFQNKLSQA